MLRAVLIVTGTLFLGLAVIGVVIPGLPTTPFVLLAAACYVRSSRRLYAWLLANRIFGKLIRTFQERRSIPRSAKIISVAAMAGMVGASVLFLVEAWWLKLLLIGLGAAGCVVVLHFPTAKDE